MNSITLNNGNQIPQMMFESFQMNEQVDMNAAVKTAADNGVSWGLIHHRATEQRDALCSCAGTHKPREKGFSRSDFFLDTKIDEWQMIAKRQIRPFVKKCLEKQI